MFNLNLQPLFWLAVFGLLCAVIIVVAGAFGLAGLVIEHMRIL